MRLHRLEVTAFGPVRRDRHGRLRRAERRRAVPALGSDRSRQDQRARRRLLRPLRRRPRRAQRRQAAALRPGRRRDAAPRGARRDPGRPAVPHRPLPRLVPPQEARLRHHPAAGVGGDQRARRRCLGAAVDPARRDRSPGDRPGRDEPHPVHPGGDAAAGPLPGVPARLLRGPAPAAPAALPHRAVRAGRALAARPTARRCASRSEDHERVVDGAGPPGERDRRGVRCPTTPRRPPTWSGGCVLGAVRQRAELAAALPVAARMPSRQPAAGLDAARAVAELRRPLRRRRCASATPCSLAHDEIAAARVRRRRRRAGPGRAAPAPGRAGAAARRYDAAEARAGRDRDGGGRAARASPRRPRPATRSPRASSGRRRRRGTARALPPREAERARARRPLRDSTARRLAAADAVAELARRAEASPASWRRCAASGRGAAQRPRGSRGRAGGGRRRAPAGRRPQPAGRSATSSSPPSSTSTGRRRRDWRLTEELLTLQQARLDGMAAELAGGSPSAAAAARCAAPSTTPTRRPRPPTRPTPRPRRRCAAGSADAEVEELARADRARDLETQAAVAEQAAGTDDTDLLLSGWPRRTRQLASAAAGGRRPRASSARLAEAEARAAATAG